MLFLGSYHQRKKRLKASKNSEGDEYLGPKKEAEEPSLTLEAGTGGPAHSYGEEMGGEIDFFMWHIARGALSEENASELKEQAKAMGYSPQTMIFGGGEDILACVPNAGEARIVRNVARSIGFPEIETAEQV